MIHNSLGTSLAKVDKSENVSQRVVNSLAQKPVESSDGEFRKVWNLRHLDASGFSNFRRATQVSRRT